MTVYSELEHPTSWLLHMLNTNPDISWIEMQDGKLVVVVQNETVV